eukprot:s2481_g22.t1
MAGLASKMVELPLWWLDTLMQIMDYMCHRGLSSDRYLFMATNKTFGFGGDASRQADWSVRLPVYINNKCEYLLRLDDGVENDPKGEVVDFDYITDESFALITNYEDLSDYIDVHEYLSTTGRPPPEQALNADETGYETASEEPMQEEPPDEDAAVRRDITDKLLKTIHMSFNQFSKQRRLAAEDALYAHQNGQKVFWEVFSGSANLSKTMEDAGWLVQCFDLDTGWNFEIASHRREFLEWLDVSCPDFVWFAPPCTIWSPLQELSMSPTRGGEERCQAVMADRDYQEATFLRMTRRGYLSQVLEDQN